jgi:hypothetical protein
VNDQTCGKGLAEQSALPGRLGDLTESVAGILEIHMGALDLQDDNSRKEYETYRELAGDHRSIAAELRETARRMAGYRDLPMGRHDTSVMSSPRAVEAFEKFVKLEQELMALLQERLEADRRMLSEMRDARS